MFLTGLGGDWILVSFFALQLKKPEQQRYFMGIVIQYLMLERVSPAPSADSEIAAGRISRGALGRFKVQKMQQGCGSSWMALGKPKRPGLCLTPVTVSRYRFTWEKVTV